MLASVCPMIIQEMSYNSFLSMDRSKYKFDLISYGWWSGSIIQISNLNQLFFGSWLAKLIYGRVNFSYESF